MAVAFITAATTVAGWHLTRYLCGLGWTVTAMIGPDEDGSALAALGAGVVRGDQSLRWVSMELLPRDVDVIFNLLPFDLGSTASSDELQNQMVHATHALLVAAADTQCHCFVHQSPVWVYAPSRGRALTEDDTQPADARDSVLIRHAQQAERRVRHSAQRGLDTIIVNTGIDLGQGSERGWMGLFGLIEAGWPAAVPQGTAVITDPEALAPAMLRAAEIGRSGDHYLLGGQTLASADLIDAMAAGIGAPTLRDAPVPLRLIDRARSGLARWRLPPLARDSLALLDTHVLVDSQRSAADLGYAPRAAGDIIADAAAWWRGEDVS